MHTKILSFLAICLLLVTYNVQAQSGSSTCAGAVKACVTTVNYSFNASTSGGSAGAGNNYGCLSTQPNPGWYYLDIAESGNINISIQSNTSGRDVDFAIWGPYSNVSTAKAACGALPAPISCSYSPSATETGVITGAQAGDTYMFLLTNYSNTTNNVSFTQTGGSGQTSCDGIPGINQQCAGAQKACLTQSGVNFAASTNAGTAPAGNNYGCLSTTPNPAWYYIKYNNIGTIDMQMQGLGNGDIDFAVWGPYPTLNAAGAACGSLPTPIACSYSGSATENASITNTAAGQIYLILLTNYANITQDVSFTQTGGTGVTDCIGTGVCVMQSITITPTSGCRDNGGGTPTVNPNDDDYTADVTVTYVNPPLVTGGTLNLGGAATNSVSVAPGFSETTYTFTGVVLPANAGTSTVSASFSADTDCTISTTVTNPGSCSPPPCITTNFDCSVAVPLCIGVNPTCTPVLIGSPDFVSQGGTITNPTCGVTEHGPGWYTFNVQQTGTLEFTLNSIADIDFAIYGPFSGTSPCNGSLTQVRCDYAGTAGIGTGLLGDGSAGGYDAALPVVAGENYMFFIDNFSSTGLGFTITWGGIAANPGGISCDSPVDCTTSSLDISAPDAVCSGANIPVTATCSGGGATIDYDFYTYQSAPGVPAQAPAGYALFGDGVAAPLNHNYPLSSANANLAYEGFVSNCGETVTISGITNNTCQPLIVTLFLAIYDSNLGNEYDTPCSFVRKDITIYPNATIEAVNATCGERATARLAVNGVTCSQNQGALLNQVCGGSSTSTATYTVANAATFWGVLPSSIPACLVMADATATGTCSLTAYPPCAVGNCNTFIQWGDPAGGASSTATNSIPGAGVATLTSINFRL